MSSGILTTLLTEAATRWPRSGTDANGQPTWATAAAVTCSNWAVANALDQTPTTDHRRATHQCLVSSSVVRGDKLYLGTSVASTPASGSLEVYEVRELTTPLDEETVYLALLGG